MVSSLIFLSYSTFADSTCSLYLDASSSQVESSYSPQLKKALQRLEILDPDLHSEFIHSSNQTAQDLYLTLKTKAWSVLPFGMLNWRRKYIIEDHLKTRWVEHYGHLYNLSKATEDQMSIFYANSLQSIYSSLVLPMKLDILNGFGLSLESAEIKDAMISQLSLLLGLDFRQAHLDPDTARAALGDPALKSFDWAKAAQEYRSIVIRKEQALCCKNITGCLFCPNNLSFKK